jgi:hypothetical protein
MSPRHVVSRLLTLSLCLAAASPAFAAFAATDSYIPSAGRGSGNQGSEWYTTIWVYNPGQTDAAVQFSFLERDKSNTVPLVFADTVPAKYVKKYNDVVFTMFGVEKFGAVRVVSDQRVVVASRVYSQPTEGEAASVGQLYAGIPASFAIAVGEKTDLIGVRQHTPADSWDFRYNYGLVETAGAAATVKISAYHQSNGFMKEKTVSLRPYEAKQWNVSDLLDGGTAWNWRLEVEVTEGPGRVIAFGSGIANASNDPSTFEMQYDDSLLAENSSVLTLPFSGSASKDGGAVLEITNTSAAAGLGIVGRGSLAGGEFAATDGSAAATLGQSDTGGTGVWAGGKQEGAYFEDTDGSGQAWIARGDRGVEGTGSSAGGAFWTPGNASGANLATQTSGVEGYGPVQGGIFGDTDTTSIAYVAAGDSGINAVGDEMGGWFAQTDLDSEAYLARGTAGINAFGTETGGYFQNKTDASAAYLGHDGYGVEAFGAAGGGHFEDLDDGTWSGVAAGSSSLAGNGAKSFVQNHPYDATKVIVYTAQEGDEVGTYTRGTARLIGGEARIALGETFQWVTNPDIGLTVYLTPVGSWSQLYVAEKSTRALVVRSAGGDPGAMFDYVVMGLRIGFEEASVVQEKGREAPIPSMAAAEARYRREPELRRHNALDRFKAMRRESDAPSPLDLSASEALRDAIGRFRPEAQPVSTMRSP